MTIEEIEQTMDFFFRDDHPEGAVGKANYLTSEYNRRVAAFNAWQSAQNRKVDKQRKELDHLGKIIDTFDNRIEEDNQNDLISDKNAVVHNFNRLTQLLSEGIDAHNNASDKKALEMDELRSAAEAASERAGEILNWFRNDSGQDFFRHLNRAYLHARSTSGAVRLREIRHELGEWACARQNQRNDGVNIVPVTLCGSEPCWMVMDTGANSVTISLTLVELLGLEDCIGESVQCRLAGGVRVDSKRITIPEITALGTTLTEIDAVILDETEVGVDGSLGMSFLSRIKDFTSGRCGNTPN